MGNRAPRKGSTTQDAFNVPFCGASVRSSVRFALLALVMASTIGCDRVTKQMATALLADRPTQSFLADTVRLAYAENTGGFLGLGASLPPAARTAIFTIATGLALVVLLVAWLRGRWSFWRALGLVLFFAGGLSNWIDRALRGSVVDFMNVGIGWLRTGIFNFADVAIMLGIALFVLGELSARPTPNGAPERKRGG
jgi:signal peptidase II